MGYHNVNRSLGTYPINHSNGTQVTVSTHYKLKNTLNIYMELVNVT